MIPPVDPFTVWLAVWLATRSTEFKILAFGVVLAGALVTLIAVLERADKEGRKQ